MRRYVNAVLIFTLIWAAGLIVFIFLSTRADQSSDPDDNTVLLLNDIAKTAEEDPSLLPSLKIDEEFVVQDNTGNLIYASENAEPVTLETAISKRYPYVFIGDGGRVKGVAILLQDGSEKISQLRTATVTAFAVCWLLLLLILIFLAFYIRKNYILPFRRMKDFAQTIAEGNLDDPLLMDRNNMFGKFTESFDIMREELAASRERELALQRKEKELVASLSHDLKTPVTGIKVTAELLKAKIEMNESSTEDTAEKLESIYEKAESIDNMVSDLFASAMDDLGEFKVNLKDTGSDAVSAIISRYDDRKLVREGEIPAVILNTDIKSLGRVIGNIISNSYKYAGTPIDVRYSLTEGFLEMNIRDYGPGVPDSEISLISNKFYRGKDWEKSGEDGNGLGLYIARMLMEKMNGEILLSNADKGFSVTLLIPLS